MGVDAAGSHGIFALAIPWGWNLESIAFLEELALALACGAIALGLVLLLRQRRDHSASQLFWWFTALISMLGLENLLEALIHLAPVASYLAGVKLIVVGVESPAQSPRGIQHKRADESRRGVTMALEGLSEQADV